MSLVTEANAPLKRSLDPSPNPGKRWCSESVAGSTDIVSAADALWDESGDLIIILKAGAIERRCKVKQGDVQRYINIEVDTAKYPGPADDITEKYWTLEERTDQSKLPDLIIDHTASVELAQPFDNTQHSEEPSIIFKTEPQEHVSTRPSSATPKWDNLPKRLFTDREVTRAYESLLLVSIARPLLLPSDVDVALREVEILVALCQRYACLDSTISYINNALTDFRQDLFKVIAKDPPRWLKLSCTLKSGLIFSESFVHIAGAFPAWPWATSKIGIDRGTLKRIEDKSRVTMGQLQTIFAKLLTNTIHVEVEDSRKVKSIPVTVYSDPGTWATVQIYRDMLSQDIEKVQTSSQASILHRERVLESRRPLGGKALLDLEEAAEYLRTLKDYAAAVVGELGKNTLMLNVEDTDIGYLTCMEVTAQDYPWRTNLR